MGSERKVDTQHGVVISFDLAPALPEVTTAPEMMTEVFNILLTNAVEAMDAAGESGRIWFTSHRTAAGDIEVSIQDNGTGIQPQHVPFIFDIGFTTRENGMGFGLFWMKDYVEALGGSVDVATMWKQGTKFTLMIPAGSQPDTSSSNGQTPG